MTALKEGQIWRDRWNRKGRLILVTHVHSGGTPVVITCDIDGNPAPRSMYTNIKPERFVATKGFSLVRDAP